MWTRIRRAWPRSKRPKSVGIVAGLTLALAGAGLAGPDMAEASTSDPSESSDAEPRHGGELRVGVVQAWGPLDAVELAGGTVGRIVANNVYDTLVGLSPDNELEPRLAESWEISDDGLTYVFQIRQEVMFQDGTPLDAAAVVSHWDRLMNPDNNCRCLDLIEPVESVEATGDFEVTFTLSEPYASFLALQVDTVGMIVSPSAVEELGDEFTQMPVGAGPYRVVSQITDAEIVLERNEDYWDGDMPYVDRVTFVVMPDNASLLASVQAGDVDIAAEMAREQVHQAQSSDSVQVVPLGSLGNQRIALNHSVAPFDDIRARQAINYATDIDSVIEAVERGLIHKIRHPFETWYPDLEVTNYPEYDPDKARELVEELGGSIDFEITANQANLPFVQALQAMWKEVGINAEISVMDPNAQIAGLVEGNFQAGTSGYSGAWDPDLVAYDMFHSGANRNYSRMEDPDVDELLEAARATSDPDERAELYDQLSQRLAETLPYVWMGSFDKYTVAQLRVHGIPVNPDGMLRLRSVWVED